MANEKTAQIIELVKGLTILELADLVKEMEETFGVSAAVAAAPAAGGAAAAPAAEEKTEFDVVLKGFDAAKKLGIIKALRTVVDGLGLADAKKIVESAPATLKSGVTKEEADSIVATMTEAGAEMEVK